MMFTRVLRLLFQAAHEVITDIAVITEKEAVPTNFVCIDYTADSSKRLRLGDVDGYSWFQRSVH